jgi:hypothetical protein
MFSKESKPALQHATIPVVLGAMPPRDHNQAQIAREQQLPKESARQPEPPALTPPPLPNAEPIELSDVASKPGPVSVVIGAKPALVDLPSSPDFEVGPTISDLRSRPAKSLHSRLTFFNIPQLGHLHLVGGLACGFLIGAMMMQLTATGWHPPVDLPVVTGSSDRLSPFAGEVRGQVAGVPVDASRDPAASEVARWSPTLLAQPHFWDSVPLLIGNFSPVFYVPAVQPLNVFSLPDTPPSLVHVLNSQEAPLKVSNTALTSAVSLGSLRPQVALFLSPVMAEAAPEAQSVFRNAGVEVISTTVASYDIATSEVRFFHEEDASDAARTAELAGAEVRDFSAYRPLPPPGRIEVWLARVDAATIH